MVCGPLWLPNIYYLQVSGDFVFPTSLPRVPMRPCGCQTWISSPLAPPPLCLQLKKCSLSLPVPSILTPRLWPSWQWGWNLSLHSFLESCTDIYIRAHSWLCLGCFHLLCWPRWPTGCDFSYPSPWPPPTSNAAGMCSPVPHTSDAGERRWEHNWFNLFPHWTLHRMDHRHSSDKPYLSLTQILCTSPTCSPVQRCRL